MQPSFVARRILAQPAANSNVRSVSSWALLGTDCRLYLIDYEPALFEPSAFDAAAIACPASVARSVPKRQAEFLFGRLAARMALSDLALPPDIEIGIGPSREPLWPDGVIGSITHSGRYVGAVAMRRGLQQGVGIDIEGVVEGKTREALLATVLDPAEAAVLKACACSEWSYDALITALFSAKESLFKAAFGAVGRYFGFEAARCTGWDRERGRLRMTLTETLCEQFLQSCVCEIGVSRLDRDTVLTHFLW